MRVGREGHFWGVWPIEKHCNAYDFGVWKRVRCAKNRWIDLNDPYVVLLVLRKKLLLGIAPALKFLVALIF